jgi:hypothetical protein
LIYGVGVGPLEENLRRRRNAIFEKLTASQRTALEIRGLMPAQEATNVLLDETAGLWEALFELASAIDELKGPGVSS